MPTIATSSEVRDAMGYEEGGDLLRLRRTTKRLA